MTRVYRLMVTVLMGALAAGCGGGGSGNDQQTLVFNSFQSPTTAQLDTVGPTSAEVDVFQQVCTDNTLEPFQETFAGAVFTNYGFSNINLDTITINIPQSGVPPYTRTVSFSLTGTQPVVGGPPVQSTVEFLLFDISTKQRMSLQPGTYNVAVTFSGVDASDARFTVPTHMTVTFADFCNCTGGC